MGRAQESEAAGAAGFGNLAGLERPALAQLVEAGRLTGCKAAALDFSPCFAKPVYSTAATLHCLTPMWLQEKGVAREAKRRDVLVPTIEALVHTVRIRIHLLTKCHEGQKWEHKSVDIDELAKRARNLVYYGRPEDRSRYSTRTDQPMHMGGFMGKVQCGSIDPALWPLLRIGAEIHAGRFTVWGNGQYQIQPARQIGGTR